MKILVPTDFSECAHNALDYALGLAADLHAELVLLHAIVYQTASYRNSPAREEENTRLYNEARMNLEKEAEHIYKKNRAIPVKSILDGGPVDLSVSSIIDSEHIDLVVMGSKGASGLKALVFGSFTSHVLDIAPCPVFTIPLTGKYSGIKKMVCATEMDETENKALQQTLAIAEKLKASLIFFNANRNEEEQRVAVYKFQQLIPQLTKYQDIDYITVETKDILNSLENYASENHPDLIVTLGKDRTFFDKLFGIKVTKKLCLHSTIPLLAFPTHKHAAAY